MTEQIMANFNYDAAVLSHVGMRRKQNQDMALINPDFYLYVVADGMGGHLGGETASRICTETVDEIVRAESSKEPDGSILQQAILTANQRIHQRALGESALKGMGTTATILKITNNIATIAQVGDSRAYFWNEQGIWQLTRDHSLVQEKLRAGLITREQMKSDEMKNVITRSVGYDMNLRADLFTLPLQRGDGILLCSDGLSGPLEEREIFAILEETIKSGTSLANANQKLIDAANAKGGEDNITAVLVRS